MTQVLVSNQGNRHKFIVNINSKLEESIMKTGGIDIRDLLIKMPGISSIKKDLNLSKHRVLL
jgi:hypothetical protein